MFETRGKYVKKIGQVANSRSYRTKDIDYMKESLL